MRLQCQCADVSVEQGRVRVWVCSSAFSSPKLILTFRFSRPFLTVSMKQSAAEVLLFDCGMDGIMGEIIVGHSKGIDIFYCPQITMGENSLKLRDRFLTNRETNSVKIDDGFGDGNITTHFYCGEIDGVVRKKKMLNRSGVVQIDEFQGHAPALIWGLEVKSTESLLFSASNDNTFRVWKLKSGICAHTFNYHSASVYYVKNVEQGIVATSSFDKTIKVTDFEKQICVHTFADHDSYACQIDYASDQRILYSCWGDKMLRLFDLRSMKLIKSLQPGKYLWSLCLLKEENEVIVGDNTNAPNRTEPRSNSIHIYDVRTMTRRETVESAHTNAIRDIVDVFDKNSILTCSEDKTVKLWGKGNTLKLLSTFNGAEVYRCACYLKKRSIIYDGLNISVIDDSRKEERIDYVLNDLPDMKVQLKNKELGLWKTYFREESIDLSDLNLNISEDVILQILESNEQVKIPHASLFDYFRFFRRFKMKKEMYFILKKLSTCSSKQICGLFQGICKTFENSQVKDIFDEKVDGIGEIRELPSHMSGFDFSFSLFLFNIMKDRESEIMKNANLSYAVGPASQCLKNHQVTNIFQHLDFFGVEKESELIGSLNLKSMYSSKSRSDIILKCMVDGNGDEGQRRNSTFHKEFKAHQIILVLKSNFFYCMLHFGGREVEELKKTGKISIEFLSENVLEQILEFIYLGEINTTSISELLYLLKHAEMYHEGEMIKCLMKRIKEGVKDKSQQELIKILEFEGHILENEILLGIVVRLFRAKLTKKKIVDLVERSLQQKREDEQNEEERKLKQELISSMNKMESRMENMEEKLKEHVKCEIDDLSGKMNSKLEDMSGKIDEVLMLLQGKGRKRKRDEDDDDEEDEEVEGDEKQDKKRRKIEKKK